MMDDRKVDELLGELFKRNVPPANEAAVQEQVRRQLPRVRWASRRNRGVRALAIGFASFALIGGAAYGSYELVDLMRDEPVLLISDPVMPVDDSSAAGIVPGETSSGTSESSVLAGLSPIAGMAVLEELKSEGTVTAGEDPDSVVRVTGEVRVYLLRTSRPELSGTLEITADLSMRTNGSADLHGSWVLTTEVGTWRCDSWTGDRSADGTEEFGVGSAAGSGDTEGLTLCLQWHPEPGSPDSMSVTGWVRSTE